MAVNEQILFYSVNIILLTTLCRIINAVEMKSQLSILHMKCVSVSELGNKRALGYCVMQSGKTAPVSHTSCCLWNRSQRLQSDICHRTLNVILPFKCTSEELD